MGCALNSYVDVVKTLGSFNTIQLPIMQLGTALFSTQ